MIPTIETSVHLQGASCNLSDVAYAFGRITQSLLDAGELELLAKLDKRFSCSEHPLLLSVIIALWIDPKCRHHDDMIIMP